MRNITPRIAGRYYSATHALATATAFTTILTTCWFLKDQAYRSLDTFADDGSMRVAITLTGIFLLLWTGIAKWFEAELGTIYYWENRLGQYLQKFPQTDEERAEYRQWAKDTIDQARSNMQDAATNLLICRIEVRLFESGELHQFCTGGKDRYGRELLKKKRAVRAARTKALTTKQTLKLHEEFLCTKWCRGAGILRPGGGGDHVLVPEPSPKVYA